MKHINYVFLMLIVFLIVNGCSGNYGTLKYQPESESKATKRELVENWFDYNIWLIYHTRYKSPRLVAIIFHAKSDNRELVLDGIGSKVKVKDQAMWTRVVKENTTSDGELALTGVQEIWGPDNQLSGFIVYHQYAVEMDRVRWVDENTLQLNWRRPKAVGGPVQ